MYVTVFLPGLKGQCVLSASEAVFMDIVNGKTTSQKVKYCAFL